MTTEHRADVYELIRAAQNIYETAKILQDRGESIPFALLAAIGHLERLPIASVKQPLCRRCKGCGQLANTEDEEPWTVWASLPPESDIAVRMGFVKPKPCDACHGTGTTTTEAGQEAPR